SSWARRVPAPTPPGASAGSRARPELAPAGGERGRVEAQVVVPVAAPVRALVIAGPRAHGDGHAVRAQRAREGADAGHERVRVARVDPQARVRVVPGVRAGVG